MTAPVLVGTSGWSYADWRGNFYPPALPPREWLRFYATRFPSVELNNSFYRQPSATQFARWAAQVPARFIFAVKAPRLLTHALRLRHTRAPLQRFHHALRGLGPQLGPVLYQLPSNLPADQSLLARFAAGLSRELRHVIEFRHPSWFCAATFATLRRHRIALCWSDHPRAPAPQETTAPFLYIRLHGGQNYNAHYSRNALRLWARLLQNFADTGTPSFLFCNNTAAGRAARNARTLHNMLSRQITVSPDSRVHHPQT